MIVKRNQQLRKCYISIKQQTIVQPKPSELNKGNTYRTSEHSKGNTYRTSEHSKGNTYRTSEISKGNTYIK